jgi:arginyl-tRNA synthetase
VIKVIAKNMPKGEYIGRIKAVKPGYLNVWLNPGWMTARLDNLIQQKVCDGINVGEGKSVNLEFISANPTGPLTLGNVRAAFSADTLGNVLECAGFDVTREYYFNDSGAQVKKLGESVIRRFLQQQGKDVEYKDDLYQGGYISGLGSKVAETLRENEGKELAVEDVDDSEVVEKVGNLAAAVLMADIKRVIKDELQIEFDVWTSEDELREGGKVEQAVKRLKKSNGVYEKDGAIFLKTSEYGDSEDRVIVKSDGEYAYVAPDIAYHQDKYDRGFDEIFTFVGADHQGHLPKILAAMEAMGNDTKKMHQVVNQWMRIVQDGKPVKLSKRAGQIITPKDLIDEVGYDAMRFFMVQHQLSGHMDFDIGLAKEKNEKNPVYYVQYAYVRLQSILRQAKQRGVIDKVGVVFDLSDSPALTHSLELDLMRQLYRLPEVITDIAREFDVHRLVYYSVDLAKAIHVFYRHVPVLAGDDKQLVENRLQLVLAAREVMGKVLDFMGVSKPEVM